MKLLLLLFISLSAHGQMPPGLASVPVTMQTDPGKAFSLARAEGKNVLLVFSGSDWCLPCIHFEKSVLADSAFLEFASTRLVVLIADFPQRRKIDAALAKQYGSLAAQFDGEGAFPKIVLVTPDKKRLGDITYIGQSPAAFIGDLDKLFDTGSSTN